MNEPAGIGHNNPPEDIELETKLTAVLQGARKAQVDHPDVTDQASADAYAGQIKILQKAYKDADEYRLENGERKYRPMIVEVNERWNAYLTRLEKVGKSLRANLLKWQKAEDERLRAEEAERKRVAAEAQAEAEKKAKEAEELARQAEAGELKGTDVDPNEAAVQAEEAAKAAKAAEKEAKRAEKAKPKAGANQSIGGGQSRSMSLQTQYFASVTSFEAASKHFLQDHRVMTAIQAAANEWAQKTKGTEELEGLKVQSRQISRT